MISRVAISHGPTKLQGGVAEGRTRGRRRGSWRRRPRTAPSCASLQPNLWAGNGDNRTSPPASGAVVAEAAELAAVWEVAGVSEPQGPADGGEALPLDSDDDDLQFSKDTFECTGSMHNLVWRSYL